MTSKLNMKALMMRHRSQLVVLGAVIVLLLCMRAFLTGTACPSSRLSPNDQKQPCQTSAESPNQARRIAPASREVQRNVPEIQVMDPLKVAPVPTAVCSPLRTAKKQEKICVFTTKEDKTISYEINIGGVWEVDFVEHVLDVLNSDPELGFIDVGANLGVYALTMASYGKQVVAFEPFPPNLGRLAQSLRISPHLIPYLTVVPMATSYKREQMHLWTRESHPGATQFHEADEAEDPSGVHKNDKLTHINATTLNDALPLIKFKKAILKIDIEGGEYKAFRGAQKLFDTVDIPMIWMEWDNKCEDPVHRNFFINFFIKNNYSVHKSSRQMEELELSEEACSKWSFDIILKKRV